MITKAQIRQYIRTQAAKVTPKERSEASVKLLDRVEQMSRFTSARSVAIYIGMSDELTTLPRIEQWHNRGVRIAIPRVVGDDMIFHEYSPENIAVGAFSILEPSVDAPVVSADEIDLMVVPALALSPSGGRMGRGRGYYDRYLAQDSFTGYTVAAAMPYQIVEILPTEPHDIFIDEVITLPPISPLPSLIMRVVESAGVDATRLGFGVEQINAMGYSWVLLRFSMSLTRLPEVDEQITIDTWISDCRKIASTRNFILYDKCGEEVGFAVTQWCMIDLTSRRAVDLTNGEIDYEKNVTSRPSPLERLTKIPPIDFSEAGIASFQHEADPHDIDFNIHVNTIRYIELMLSMVEPEHLALRGATNVDLQFVSESRLGDLLVVNHQNLDEKFHFEISRHEEGVERDSISVKAIFDLA